MTMVLGVHIKRNRSMFGLGAKCCVLYPNIFNTCKYQEEHPRPKAPPMGIKGRKKS